MGEYFGTDGIRGVAGRHPLDQQTIERIGYLLVKELTARINDQPLIIIGRDTRESGEWIEAAMMRGIYSGQGTGRSAGIITTPGVAYLTRALGASAGIVISASHNPYLDNGIKIFSPSGRKLDDAAEEAIEGNLNADSPNFPPVAGVKIEPDSGLTEQYLSFLCNEIGAGLKLNSLRIVIDCANGASFAIAPKVFTRLGADITVINAEPNGRNINLDCGSLHPEKLREKVRETGADLGLAFDGDADRLLLVDEHGDMVDGDQMLFIMATYLASRSKLAGNRVVATIMSNLGLELALTEQKIELVRTAVGDKYVLDELLKGGGSLGGEQSGHIIYPEISLAGDGIITGLEVLRVLTEEKQTLSELARGFKRYPQITINIRVSRKPPLETIPAIKQAINALENEMDGKGRLIVRYSGTENLARVMIEGQGEMTIRTQAEALAKVISEEIG
ncbi:MAG: phosphoglucosamine mutase [Acidobacteria bacterium]|nr:phosphoglucosamine mutase [Acidobacteriota bacterium]